MRGIYTKVCPELSEVLQKIGFENGIQWCIRGKTPQFLDSRYLFLQKKEFLQDMQPHPDFTGVDTVAFIHAMKNVQPPIELGSYTAVFEKGLCKVGCVTIDLPTAEKIVERMKASNV